MVSWKRHPQRPFRQADRIQFWRQLPGRAVNKAGYEPDMDTTFQELCDLCARMEFVEPEFDVGNPSLVLPQDS